MKKHILWLFLSFTILSCQNNKLSINSITKESTEQMNDNISLILNSQTYQIKLENNDTVNQLISMLPLTIEMNELNGNEKYCYLDTTLKVNPIKIKNITKGDVMIYGTNCLVIFYKSFATQYSYTKIGHIDNFVELDNSNIKVTFTK